jgi:hypothetical protein
MELPANMMTPTVCSATYVIFNMWTKFGLDQAFTERVKKEFEGVANVEIIVRDEGTQIPLLISSALIILLFIVWAAEKNMV